MVRRGETDLPGELETVSGADEHHVMMNHSVWRVREGRRERIEHE